MRDILFKAKRIDNGEWVEGGVLHQTDYYGDKVDKYFIIDGTCTVDYDIGETFEVDENTVCQYTGLKDKNGNKIWENDIVKCYADTDDLGNDLYFFYKVIWHESYHCWWLSDIHTLEDEYLHQFNPSDIEVIGNIFDNPELLNYVDNDASKQAHQEVLKLATE